ncbi:hypothetical protein OHA70_34335 [Kribbella sp. NBC_00382]|uniref:hypothetical protein n=1 Tax=Kribbella sp. NBC_00382 TaxID=2975967 RepID=UPI002E1CDB1E
MVRMLGPGESEQEYTARGSRMFFKALAGQDDGDLSLMERTLPVGGRRPPPHRHTNAGHGRLLRRTARPLEPRRATDAR